jgi:hypothetical protein
MMVTIDRPDVIALIEDAANRLTDGDKTEAVALAMRRLLNQNERKGSLFGRYPGSVCFSVDYDPFAQVLDAFPDAENGREINR